MNGLSVLFVLLATAYAAALRVQDVEGREIQPLQPQGPAEVLFFITNDCPISNFYAPEIQRICSEFAGQGVSCALVYVDPQMNPAAVRKHLGDYGYHGIPAILDSRHKLVEATGAKVTPEAIVIGHDGKVRYSGRIDNFYAGLGKPRRQATTHDLRTALAETLSGKPVTTLHTDPVGCYIPSLDAANPTR
jgi:hypothetical protein